MDNDANQNDTFFRFEDLRIYHKSLDYIDWVYTAVSMFPENVSATLGKKFIDKSENISFCISEGSARNKSQFIYYLKMAKSAIRECVVLTTVAEKQSFLSETQVGESRNELMEMTKMIGALIGSLQKSNGPKGRHKPNVKNENREVNDYDQNEDMVPADNMKLY